MPSRLRSRWVYRWVVLVITRECHRQSSWWKMMENEAVSAAYSRWHGSPLWQEERCIGGGDHSQVESSLATVSIFTAANLSQADSQLWQKRKRHHVALLQNKRSTNLCLWNNMFYILYFISTFKNLLCYCFLLSSFGCIWYLYHPNLFILKLYVLFYTSGQVNYVKFEHPSYILAFTFHLGVYSVFSCPCVGVVH